MDGIICPAHVECRQFFVKPLATCLNYIWGLCVRWKNHDFGIDTETVSNDMSIFHIASPPIAVHSIASFLT